MRCVAARGDDLDQQVGDALAEQRVEPVLGKPPKFLKRLRASCRFAAVDMAEALGIAGEIADGFAVIDDAIARAERTDELWQLPSCCA